MKCQIAVDKSLPQLLDNTIRNRLFTSGKVPCQLVTRDRSRINVGELFWFMVKADLRIF